MERQTLSCRIGAGLSTSESAWNAATEAAHEAGGSSRGQAEIDLAFLFLSSAHLDDAETAAQAVRDELAPRHLLGCVAEGVVARVRELEEGPSVAVWAGSLPGAEVEYEAPLAPEVVARGGEDVGAARVAVELVLGPAAVPTTSSRT